MEQPGRPDGHRLVFSVLNNGPSRPSGASALFSVSANGHGMHQITAWDTAAQVSSPAFSPNGKLVLFQITFGSVGTRYVGVVGPV